jgi:hypothetical protein
MSYQPLLRPRLREHETPFIEAEEVVIDAATHGLGSITLHTCIVQVRKPTGGEDVPPDLLPLNVYVYTIDAASHAVTVVLATPQSGTVRLITIDNAVEEEQTGDGPQSRDPA